LKLEKTGNFLYFLPPIFTMITIGIIYLIFEVLTISQYVLIFISSIVCICNFILTTILINFANKNMTNKKYALISKWICLAISILILIYIITI